MSQAPVIVPSIESRYTAATLEKCSRIQARQIVQLTYISLSGPLVATLLSGGFYLIPQLSDYAAFVLAVGVPCVAAIFAAWCGNQDSVIALLDSYCRRLEEFGAELTGRDDAPRWYGPQHPWFPASVIGRNWSHVAFGVALFGASLPGTLIIYLIDFKRDAIAAQFAIVLLGLAYRLWRLPAALQPLNRLRYHVVTGVLVLALAAIAMIFFYVTPRPVEHRINYPHHILVFSAIASLLPLAIYLEFERRRIHFLVRP